MHRKCQNQYRNCQNFAVCDTGRAWVQRLCAECLARRREKQRITAAQPNCHCGNKMREGASQCRGCDFKAEQRSERFINFAEDLRMYYEYGIKPE